MEDVRIKSADGHVFVVRKGSLSSSVILKDIFSGEEPPSIVSVDVESETLAIVVTYLVAKTANPSFDGEALLAGLGKEGLMGVLDAAKKLEIPSLLDVSVRVASKVI